MIGRTVSTSHIDESFDQIFVIALTAHNTDPAIPIGCGREMPTCFGTFFIVQMDLVSGWVGFSHVICVAFYR